jgi:hypothetical protein
MPKARYGEWEWNVDLQLCRLFLAYPFRDGADIRGIWLRYPCRALQQLPVVLVLALG